MKFYRLGYGVCLVALAFTSCNGRSLDLVNEGNANASVSSTNSASQKNQNDTKSDEPLNYLDLNNPQIEQSIEAGDREVERSKFVQVEVTEVHNPQKYPIKFQVSFQPKDGEKIFLGSFGLFPPDNPGRFIVATQGKVKGEGKIILSLVTSEQAKAGDTLRVGVKRIRLRSE
ncbi:MAG TPA: hypothetical protein VN844_14450 [Pyrinomonadaceae bacterium]|nr:hypothetical protein [Pyrinomonadaceae bacterium]